MLQACADITGLSEAGFERGRGQIRHRGFGSGEASRAYSQSRFEVAPHLLAIFFRDVCVIDRADLGLLRITQAACPELIGCFTRSRGSTTEGCAMHRCTGLEPGVGLGTQLLSGDFGGGTSMVARARIALAAGAWCAVWVAVRLGGWVGLATRGARTGCIGAVHRNGH